MFYRKQKKRAAEIEAKLREDSRREVERLRELHAEGKVDNQGRPLPPKCHGAGPGVWQIREATAFDPMRYYAEYCTPTESIYSDTGNHATLWEWKRVPGMPYVNKQDAINEAQRQAARVLRDYNLEHQLAQTGAVVEHGKVTE